MKNKTNKKLIISKTLISITTLILTISFATNAFASEITPENISYLINKERSYYGLAPLKNEPALNHAATMKSKDMINRNYFEHYAFGLTPWDFIHNSGYNYLYAGENLAMDFRTSEGMVKAWMNSPMHRENILSPDFEDMGIGVVKGAYVENGVTKETTVVTNMFGREKPPIVDFFNKIVKNISLFFKF